MELRRVLSVAKGEKATVDAVMEHLGVASRAAEHLVAAFEDVFGASGDMGISLLKVSRDCGHNFVTMCRIIQEIELCNDLKD